MTFWVYILECRDGSYYTGHTDNLDVRLAEHRAGRGGSHTARRLPVDLRYSARFESRIDALSAERQIKGWSRAKKAALITGDWAALKAAARRPAERT